MGTVWLAEDVTLKRQVAIQLISGSSAGSAVVRARVLREARTMASVEHPNVVRLYAFGESDGHPYLVMERVEGQSLEEVLRDNGPLPATDALRILRECALALEAAAKQGLVHRVIKPANILLICNIVYSLAGGTVANDPPPRAFPASVPGRPQGQNHGASTFAHTEIKTMVHIMVISVP